MNIILSPEKCVFQLKFRRDLYDIHYQLVFYFNLKDILLEQIDNININL